VRLADAEKQGIHKIVLDLRSCGRGQSPKALRRAAFHSSGTIATLRGQTVSTQTFSADPAKVV